MIRFKDLITSSVYQYLNSISLIQNPKVWMALPSTGLEEERKKEIYIQQGNHSLFKSYNFNSKKNEILLCVYTRVPHKDILVKSCGGCL